MMKYKYAFFDLDGTLTDSQAGIINSIMYSLDKNNLPYRDREYLKRYIGPPRVEMFKSEYSVDDTMARKLVADFRERFKDIGIFENEVYGGIPELCEKLEKAGVKLVVATSKPEMFAVRIMDHFDLSKYFVLISGSMPDETRTDKAEVICHSLNTLGITDRSQVIMVGDRFHDVEGAAKNGLDCIGVLYGYGSREELTKAGAAFIAPRVEDIFSIIEGK